MPTYNRSYCLPYAISSILAQSYSNTEIVIIDDNSSDDTEEVCKKFQKTYPGKIKYHKNIEQFGPAKSRNIGINYSKGEYITFLDSDDIYYYDKIQLQLELMGRDESVGFCFGNFTTAYDIEDVGSYNYIKLLPPAELYPSFLLPKNFYIVTPAVMLRSSILEKTGLFDSDLRICEDLELWSRVLLQTKFAYVTKPIVSIHLRKGEKTKIFENILARDKLYQRVFMRDNTLAEDFKRRLYSELIDLYISTAHHNSSFADFQVLNKMKQSCTKHIDVMRSEILELAAKHVVK